MLTAAMTPIPFRTVHGLKYTVGDTKTFPGICPSQVQYTNTDLRMGGPITPTVSLPGSLQSRLPNTKSDFAR